MKRSWPRSCLALVVSLACGGESSRREPVAISVQPVPVRWVVVGLAYRTYGNLSTVYYGHSDALELFDGPPTAVDLGGRWRGLVRSRDGEERVAALGPIDVESLKPVTPASGSYLPVESGVLGSRSLTDTAPPGAGATVWLWLNPTAVVTTYDTGDRSIAWSVDASAEVCASLGGCPAPLAIWIPVSTLAADAPHDDELFAAVWRWLGPADRAAIVAYDPFADPRIDPSAVVTGPRFEHLRSFAVREVAAPEPTPVEWTPCVGALADADFPVLAEAPGIAFGDGDTLLVQHSVQSATATCPVQRPGLELGTSTPGCAIDGEIYVDRAFGGVLMLPSFVSPACASTP